MILKNLGVAAMLLPLVLVPAVGVAQTSKPAAPSHQSSPPAAPAAAAQPAAGASVPTSAAATAPSDSNSSALANCQGGACDAPTPHITIATPAPAPGVWPLQDRISWVANLVLVLIAYVGVMLAISTLRKIERQGRYAETAAQAAADSAKAALLYAQGRSLADRPWILVTAEAAPSAPDSFSIVATNRGHTPAKIVTIVDEIVSAGDESLLPPAPVFKNEPQPPRVPIILLPGESTGIKSFSRDEVSSVCETPEQLKRVEDWDEKIYLYGNVAYSELLSPDETQVHETAWCCWYIHGRQKSGMVTAGPPVYNRHS